MRTLALATLASLVASLFTGSPANAQIPWQTNLRAAHTQAEAEGKLLLLHFYTDNCVYCDRLEEGSFKAPQVGQAISEDFVPVKVHAKSAPELVKMFKVTKFPTDVVVSTAGKKLLHQVSPQDPTKYVAMLAGTLSSSKLATEEIAAVAPPDPPAPETIAVVPSATSPSIASTQPGLTLPGSATDFAPPADLTPSVADIAPSAPGLALPGSVEATTVSATPQSAANTQLSGYRQNEMSLDLPAQESASATPQVAASNPVATSNAEPELAMEGFCAVTVISEDRWVEGKPEHGVIHLGKLYLFHNEEAKNQFLADPIPYTPVLNEIDVVRFFEERVIVPGKREWGVKDPNYQRMFFFADEAAMNHFIDQHLRYTDAAIEVMQTAVKDANPGS